MTLYMIIEPVHLLPEAKCQCNGCIIVYLKSVIGNYSIAMYYLTLPCLWGCMQSVFKTLSSSAVTRLELGGPSGQPRDRIFISSGAIVKGYTRRGKQFLDFNTNTTEPVRSL